MYRLKRAMAHTLRFERNRSYQKWSLLAVVALLLNILPVAALVPTVSAAGGDFANTDFAAAAPFTYDHATGGGAYNDRTVGDFNDVTEQLEGGEFTCGDTVSYLAQIEVEAAPVDAVQTIELDVSFLANSTGQAGAALSDIVNVQVNYGQVENGDDGTGVNPGAGSFGLDSGINDDGGSTATLVAETLTGPLFVAGSELLGTVRITDLEASETVVVRIDVLLACEAGSSPTGNLQAQLAAGRVIEPAPDTINTGAQTIPFLKIGEIFGAGEPLLTIVKTVTTASGTCGVDDVDMLNANVGETVKYCYSVSNPGTADLFDVMVVDDNGTPGNTSDDFTVALGLADLDGEADLGDLAGVTTVTGEELVVLSSGGTLVNTATATGNNGRSGGNYDELEAVDTATVEVAGPTNQPPVAVDDSATTNEDTAVTINATANDSDPDNNLDQTTAVVTDGPSNGTVVNHGDGTFTYTPDPNFNGQDSFDYEVCDTDGLCATATVTITVTSINDAPVAVDDSYNAAEDTPLVIAAPGVLDNDTDVDGDTLVVDSYTQPTNGSVVQNPDGSFTYTPDADFCGLDSYTYVVSDGNGGTDEATVVINVACVNDAPDAVNDVAAVDEDGSVDIPVLNNDSDPDGDPLTVTEVSDPPHGTATINPDGTVTYAPDANFCGEDAFTYTISDGNGGTDTATVTVDVVCVNDPPVAQDDEGTTPEDTPITIDAAANDTDIDDNLVAASATPLTASSNGTVTNNGDGTFTYTPNLNFNGTDSFDYQICDTDNACATATVTIHVTPVNDAPDAVDDDATVDEDGSVNIPVLNNDSDPDSDPLTVIDVSNPPNGTATINPDGTVTYAPDANFCGEDTFTYTISDGNGATDTATVTVDVVCVNDPPVAQDDTAATDEDIAVNIPVLDNDSDPDGDPLTVTEVSDPPNGTATINPDGTVTYTPDPDFNGEDSFTYTICDPDNLCDTAEVVVTIGALNDAPVAQDDYVSTPEDVALLIDAAANDLDVDDNLDPSSTQVLNGPSNGTVVNHGDGTFTYTPSPDFNGPDSFTYEICDLDGLCAMATVYIEVTPVNDAPVANDDSYNATEDTPLVIPAPGVLDNDTDVDGDTLVVDSFTQPTNGSVVQNPDGSFTYTPDADFCGVDSYTYIVSDGNGGTDEATVTINVACVNDAPVAVDDSGTTNEDEVLNIPAPGVLVNDTDVDGDSLFVDSYTQPSNGSVVQNPDGSFSYTPDANFNGEDSYTYVVSDGNGGTDEATVIITVIPVNDAPVANDDSYNATEDTPLVIPAPGVLDNDTDVDSDTLVVDSYTQPANGILTQNPDGSFSYTPNQDFCGVDGYTYVVSDGNGGTDEATVTIDVACVNDAPVAVDDSGSTDEDSVLNVTAPGILSNDYDVDNDVLTVSAVNGDPAQVGQQIELVSGALLTVNTDGSYSFDPNGQYDYLGVGDSAQESFTYAISDGNGGSDTAEVIITITGVNDAPVAVDDAYVTAQDTPVTIPAPGVLDNDSDVDGDAITVDSFDTSGQFGGSISMNADGSFTYTPAPGFTGFDSFTYTITDGVGGYATATVTVEVTPRNNRSISVDFREWTYDGETRSFSGEVLVTNQSSGGYDVQITDMNIWVQVRSANWDYKGWMPVALVGDSCSFDPDPYFMISDQQLVTFSGCELVYAENGELIPADASIRLTAEVEIYGRFKGVGKTLGQNRGLFISRNSMSVGEAIDKVQVTVASAKPDDTEEEKENGMRVLLLPVVSR